jgi:hypothetical protein
MAYSEKEEQEILETAKKRYNGGYTHWHTFFEENRDVLRFIEGDQWTDSLRNSREAAGLPVLTSNLIGSFLRQITNESRQNTPAIQIDPKDNDASKETAEVYADLIRAIEQQSNASFAYDNAVWYAAATGLGFLRVRSERKPMEFVQNLVIEPINDPETVIMDPMHKALDASDAEWCFIISKLTKDEYNRQFQNSKLKLMNDQTAFSAATSSNNKANQWVSENEIIIAEYYWKEYTPVTLYKLFDTTTGEEHITMEKPTKEELDNQLVIITDQLPTVKIEVKWAKINDVEILEETTWPGTQIPVVAVKGEEMWIAGERKLKGAVKDAIDTQRSFNYFNSQQAELVTMAPKAPWVGTPEQFANFEQDYANANTSSIAYLKYNAVSKDGQLLPAPQRQTVEVPIQAAMQQCAQAKDNLKSIFGIFDASLGAQGNETSGVAIMSRQQQSHTSNYHYYDNLTKAIQQIGNILVETIPVFYADERSVQVIKRNGDSATMSINGEQDKHNLTVGNYGVVVETGPSYATKRQEAVESMMALGGVYPQAMPLIADIMVTNADWPEAKKVAARLALMLPPQIQQAEAAGKDGVDHEQQAQMAIAQLQQVNQQLQQADQVIQQGHQEITNLTEEIKTLKTKSAVEMEKATMDKDLKEKQMRLDELTTELEYKIKLRELAIQEEELTIQKSELAIKASMAASQVAESMHEQHLKSVAVEASLPGKDTPSSIENEDSGKLSKDTLE